jgi:hypothetical protein
MYVESHVVSSVNFFTLRSTLSISHAQHNQRPTWDNDSIANDLTNGCLALQDEPNVPTRVQRGDSYVSCPLVPIPSRIDFSVLAWSMTSVAFSRCYRVHPTWFRSALFFRKEIKCSSMYHEPNVKVLGNPPWAQCANPTMFFTFRPEPHVLPQVRRGDSYVSLHCLDLLMHRLFILA